MAAGCGVAVDNSGGGQHSEGATTEDSITMGNNATVDSAAELSDNRVPERRNIRMTERLNSGVFEQRERSGGAERGGMI